ncbi:hypothetical protein [Pseudovibrio sp. Tun.PSC04-5.I4]|uniref:hypothetical protein n=1 Tax=Pseudovibrio sp. Tun.PSC04-5.I4 TaxID=1798213 RepID=UPI000AB7D42E|nr:hypothetical protein [Pseudovibrio sp. Tun.PSC04-5.I4]
MLILPNHKPSPPADPTPNQLEDYYTNYANASPRPYYAAAIAIVGLMLLMLFV